jgi:oxygen-independent coproporphyrinogen-3 oxidase
MIKKPSQQLIDKYLNAKGSFYTSYPGVGLWKDDYYQTSENELLKNINFEEPINIYIHFPFCEHQCYYCICHTVISNNRDKMNKFMKYILKEIDIMSEFFKKNNIQPNIQEIHLGGGSPTLMTQNNLLNLKEKLSKFITFDTLNEFNIEIDFRTIDKTDLIFYNSIGINRLSFGIQDFDLKVQEGINRVQEIEILEELLSPDIKKLFTSINFDLIYGFPHQTTESFIKTIDSVIQFDPDRISLYSYGHRPEAYKHHGLMDETTMPSDDDKIEIKFNSIKKLLDEGYDMVGIDHFSKSNDTLSQAKKDNRISRSFMGYTPGRCPNILGIGPSSMSSMEEYYFQNVYSLKEYYSLLDENKLPIFRGYKLNHDDLIRREVINNIMTNFYVDFENVNKEFKINFVEYFKDELNSLTEFIDDAIVTLNNSSLQVTDVGENFARNIAQKFDKYFSDDVAFGHSKLKI